jgi:superoxide dismutase, Fe-Mn family
MGKALGGGSGWVLLSWSPRNRKLVNQWASDHCHTLAGGTPVLALDMYEHSYHIDFGAKAGSYVDAFMGALRWDNADRLIGEVTKVSDPKAEIANRRSPRDGTGGGFA